MLPQPSLIAFWGEPLPGVQPVPLSEEEAPELASCVVIKNVNGFMGMMDFAARKAVLELSRGY